MIGYHSEGGQVPPSASELSYWIEEVIRERGGKPGELNFIFCSDHYLHDLNVTYLDHDTLTDIITFPYGTFPHVSGDLFISTDRVRENADEFDQSYTDELHRVMIHGILHLCGQEDKTPTEASRMRSLEQWALAKRVGGGAAGASLP